MNEYVNRRILFRMAAGLIGVLFGAVASFATMPLGLLLGLTPRITAPATMLLVALYMTALAGEGDQP